jgi:HEPN domain-containing protein
VEEKMLTPAERLEIVQNDFDHWFERAYQFFEFYKVGIEKHWLKAAAFQLHQATEAAYKTILIVFTNYIPDEHYLALLGGRAAQIDPALWEVFQAKTPFEREAFTALEYAYVGARYDKRYVINEPSLIYLAERVELLLKRTEVLCRKKIADLRSAVA